VSDGVCFEYACVREKVCRYSSVSEENEREGTESSFYEGRPFCGRERSKEISPSISINKAVSYLPCQHSANIKLSNPPHPCLFTHATFPASFSPTFLSPITVPLSDSLIIVFVFFLLSLTQNFKHHIYNIYVCINTYLHPDRGGL
jgi:hypothetical protein